MKPFGSALWKILLLVFPSTGELQFCNSNLTLLGSNKWQFALEVLNNAWLKFENNGDVLFDNEFYKWAQNYVSHHLMGPNEGTGKGHSLVSILLDDPIYLFGGIIWTINYKLLILWGRIIKLGTSGGEDIWASCSCNTAHLVDGLDQQKVGP